MRPLKKSVSITLDLPVLERVSALAEAEDRSLSSYITLALKDHLARLDASKEESKNGHRM